MKKALCIAAILTLVTVASADVRVFVTSSSDPAGLQSIVGGPHPGTNAFAPTFATAFANGVFSGAYDYYYHKLSAAPAQDAPSGTAAAPVSINAGAFAYIWFQFRAEPSGAKVNGMQITVTNLATGLPATGSIVYYKQDNRNSFTPPADFRWDGTATPPAYPEWTNNPQSFVAIQAAGLKDDTASTAWNLYTWQTGGTKTNPAVTGVSLLGALNLGQGNYSIQCTGVIPVNYASGANPTLGAAGFFSVVPEPASLALMGLAGLLIRRR